MSTSENKCVCEARSQWYEPTRTCVQCDANDNDKYFNPQTGQCVSACPTGWPYNKENGVRVCYKECTGECACDPPMIKGSESGICECDTAKGFVPTSNGCMCKSGMYWFTNTDNTHSCIAAADCN